jgi:hypothetical protein
MRICNGIVGVHTDLERCRRKTALMYLGNSLSTILGPSLTRGHGVDCTEVYSKLNDTIPI